MDTTLLYQGGSGGFMYFYYLLLGGGHTTINLKEGSVTEIQELISKQYPKTLVYDSKPWKTTEIMSYTEVDSVTSKPKLFIICNPVDDDRFTAIHKDIAMGSNVILLYTDIRTQVAMAFRKKAYWFVGIDYSSLSSIKGAYRSALRSAIEWNGDLVDPKVVSIIDQFDNVTTVKLQSVLSNPCSDAQGAFINYWISLHSKKMQKLLCQ